MRRIYEYEDLQPVLERLLEDKETNDMEFKTAKGGFPHSMWETYSSFANTDGGAIIFGIKEKDGRFYLDGLTKEKVEQYEKDFFNGMHNKQIVNINNLKETLQKMFGNKLDTLDHNQLMALALAYSEEEISNERLQCALEMHKADISKMLGKLCKLQLLESSGYGRGTKYHVYGVDVSKKGKVATSDQKVATSKAKYSRDELIKLIVNYCTEWRTLDDISVFIGRNRKYLRNKVLPQMTNVLEKMYENIPNHPRQKYRARRKEADA